MYDYRRMTPEERKAIVAFRQSRGVPLHKPAHPDQGPAWYLITAATFEHVPHFAQPRELTALVRRLLEAFDAASLPCAGWVVLPNHYHAVVQTETLSAVGRALGPVHGRSARYANQRDATPGRQVWYKFSDRKIRSDRHFWTCLHYVIWNPVKHALVRDILDWPWSCVHEMLVAHGPEWIDDLRRDYALRDFGRGWDD
jgi:putative transposase